MVGWWDWIANSTIRHRILKIGWVVDLWSIRWFFIMKIVDIGRSIFDAEIECVIVATFSLALCSTALWNLNKPNSEIIQHLISSLTLKRSIIYIFQTPLDMWRVSHMHKPCLTTFLSSFMRRDDEMRWGKEIIIPISLTNYIKITVIAPPPPRSLDGPPTHLFLLVESPTYPLQSQLIKPYKTS